jgi:hypothetical protein
LSPLANADTETPWILLSKSYSINFKLKFRPCKLLLLLLLLPLRPHHWDHRHRQPSLLPRHWPTLPPPWILLSKSYSINFKLKFRHCKLLLLLLLLPLRPQPSLLPRHWPTLPPPSLT